MDLLQHLVELEYWGDIGADEDVTVTDSCSCSLFMHSAHFTQNLSHLSAPHTSNEGKMQ